MGPWATAHIRSRVRPHFAVSLSSISRLLQLSKHVLLHAPACTIRLRDAATTPRASCRQVPRVLAADHDISPAALARRGRVLAEPWTVEHQGACPRLHDGERRNGHAVRDPSDDLDRHQLRAQARVLVQHRAHPRDAAHRLRARRALQAVPCMAREHGVAPESDYMYAVKYAARGGGRRAWGYLAVQVSHVYVCCRIFLLFSSRCAARADYRASRFNNFSHVGVQVICSLLSRCSRGSVGLFPTMYQ